MTKCKFHNYTTEVDCNDCLLQYVSHRQAIGEPCYQAQCVLHGNELSVHPMWCPKCGGSKEPPAEWYRRLHVDVQKRSKAVSRWTLNLMDRERHFSKVELTQFAVILCEAAVIGWLFSI